MNISVFSVRSLQKAMAVIALFALMFSPFMNVNLASADHDPYGGLVMKKIILCHDESGDGTEYHSSGGVAVSAALSGHGGHTTDIIPPFHHKDGSYAGMNWNEVNADIWANGACDGDGIVPVPGCMDENANNYNPDATVSDDSCEYDPVPVLGCMDENATNYNPLATVSDDSCTYPDPDPEDVPGCTDENANNYNPDATVGDGSCTYDPIPVLGCMDENANNYNEDATVSDGSCTYDPVPVLGCMDDGAVNYNPDATEDNGTCIYEDPTYLVYGYVWHDENENDVRDISEEDSEDFQGGWLVTITDGEYEDTTTSDENGYYEFEVPAGNYTITEESQSGWGLTYPNVGYHTVCVPVSCAEQVSFIDEVVSFFIPTAMAQVPGFGPFDFGNVRTAPSYSQGSYGGGNGTRIELRDGGGDSEEEDEPEGEVLGEATSTLPVGAPATGAGGAGASLEVHVVAAILATRRSVKNG